jgi:hypothetical protein
VLAILEVDLVFKDRKDSLQKNEGNSTFQKVAEPMKTVVSQIEQDKTVFTLAKDNLLTAISIMGDKESLKKMLDEELRIAFEEYDDKT